VFEHIGPYLKIFGLLVGSSFGLPIPEDLALIIAGIFVSNGAANPLLMALVCYIGGVLGDTGPAIFRRRWIRSRIRSKRLRSLRDGLSRKVFLTVLVARHLFYLRTITFLLCGVVRMPFSRFLIADSIAALITVPLLMGLGYAFGEHQDLLIEILDRVKFYLLVAGVIFAWCYLFRRQRVKRKAARSQQSHS
jgi:membrane protein DedA with SNARE-associated domain